VKYKAILSFKTILFSRDEATLLWKN